MHSLNQWGKGKTLGDAVRRKGPSPRPGHQIFSGPDDDSELVGYVTSGGPSPSLGMTGIALGYLEDYEEGQDVWIQSSSRRRIKSRVRRTPFL